MSSNVLNITLDELLERLHLPTHTEMETIRFPETVGEGTIERVRLHSGTEIHKWDFQLQKNDDVEITSPISSTDLNFLLHGHVDYCIDGVSHHAKENDVQLSFRSQVKKIKYIAGVPMTFLKIRIPTQKFDDFIEQLSPNRNPRFELIDEVLGRSYGQEVIDPAVQVILWQILRCPYPKEIRNLYIEAKVMELLSIYFYYRICQAVCGLKDKPSILRGDDAEKIHVAQQFLLQHMENPPSLIELARQVGLNDFKLKAGFKELFGTTVFGYLREKRLEKAFCLLQQGQLNISEVAYSVGYSNSGYFAGAFKEKYGLKPSQVYNEIRSR
ncbi:helix-turn-helix transcriptional regulator [Paenibacillus elgii]|uniref:helix-turn-helix transcriptional regulator n=1 Tax=Paenibacillus elgii TaxID=189691 RepID=UPI00167A2ACD|nr:AraC family transcriptional regulator [Paenibacillus elgii]